MGTILVCWKGCAAVIGRAGARLFCGVGGVGFGGGNERGDGGANRCGQCECGLDYFSKDFDCQSMPVAPVTLLVTPLDDLPLFSENFGKCRWDDPAGSIKTPSVADGVFR